MQFQSDLVPGTMIKRYKRFLADIQLDQGEVVTAHVPNTGSMKSCWAEGWKVLLHHNPDPKRKLKYTLELINNGESWIGVNTHLPNKIVKEAIEKGQIPELQDYDEIQTEVPYGENSRVDLMLAHKEQVCYVEVKNVTLRIDDICLFPDAVSQRAVKHLYDLLEVVDQGQRAVLFLLVQREDVKSFIPAFHVDPEYAFVFAFAQELGVEVLIYQCQMNPQGIEIGQKLPLDYDRVPESL